MASRGVRVEVDGLGKLKRELRGLGDDLADLKDANAAAGQLVAHAAAPRAPHRTGRLAASIRANRAAGKATILAGGARLIYAGPIHWGWPGHHIEANPFISAAATDTEPQWLPLYEANIQKVVDGIAGTY